MNPLHAIGMLLSVVAVLNARPAGAAALQPVVRQAQARTIVAPDGRQMEILTGFVDVPEHRRAPRTDARRIELAVVRLRWAGANSAGSPANMVLAGGPGDSGTSILTALPAAQAAALLDLMGGEAISFDQRGTGLSRPSLATSEILSLAPGTPGSEARWLEQIRPAARHEAQRLTAAGVRLASFTSEESADDVDAVRRAFGHARITLWGRSYGSHLALATARRHPDTIARLVLVSPEGPDHTLKLPSQVDAAIRRLGERAGVPGLPDTMRAVIDRLRRSPVTVTVTDAAGARRQVAIGAFDLQWITAQALGDPRALATLPIAYREMAGGDFTRVGPLALALRTRWPLGSAMKHMMDLASFASASRLARIRREAGTALLGNAINFPVMDLRGAWPAADLGDRYRMPVQSDVPTLILVGDLDARTPIENAREIAAGLSRSTVVIVENAAHQFDLFGQPVIQHVLEDFLRDRPTSASTIRLPPIPFQR